MYTSYTRDLATYIYNMYMFVRRLIAVLAGSRFLGTSRASHGSWRFLRHANQRKELSLEQQKTHKNNYDTTYICSP